MPSRKSQQVVMRLFDAIIDNDRDRIRSFFTDDSVFHPPAQEPLVGYAAICSALTERNKGGAGKLSLSAVVARHDGRVQAERIERHLIDGEWQELKFTGVLAVDGCKITQWWDACDAPADGLRA